MNLEQFTQPGRPCFYVTTLDKDELENLSIHPFLKTHAVSVKKIQGRFCRTTTDLLREFSAALQFPYYFGFNWHAFNDCLFDMEWDRGAHYALIIFDANDLLVDTVSDRVYLFDILSTINAEWTAPNAFFPRNREPTAFHVILHAEKAHVHIVLECMDRFKCCFEMMGSLGTAAKETEST